MKTLTLILLLILSFVGYGQNRFDKVFKKADSAFNCRQKTTMNYNYWYDTLTFHFNGKVIKICTNDLYDLLISPRLNITDNDSIFEIKNKKGRSVLKINWATVDVNKEAFKKLNEYFEQDVKHETPVR